MQRSPYLGRPQRKVGIAQVVEAVYRNGRVLLAARKLGFSDTVIRRWVKGHGLDLQGVKTNGCLAEKLGLDGDESPGADRSLSQGDKPAQNRVLEGQLLSSSGAFEARGMK